MGLTKLREKHVQLLYKDFNAEFSDGNLKIIFNFFLSPDIYFYPEVIFPNIDRNKFESLGTKIMDNLIFNLGMVELVSYWKAACPKEIIIKAGILDEGQIAWWKDLFIKGLGEFFYKNKIDFTPDDFIQIKSESDKIGQKFEKSLQERDLVLIGGGKDSAVALKLLQKNTHQVLLLNPIPSALAVSENKNPIIIKRTIDPKLLELNQQGYLNGHTPFSAYLAFVSTLAAHLYDYKNIIVSNESSSNEGNTSWMGQIVNHQYSKTFEFEQKFRDYSQKYLSIESNYFSFLRPLNELQIAKIFSQMPEFFDKFKSCNVGSKQGIWCLQCSKCLFAYLMLYPFLGSSLKKIFGKDLFDDVKLSDILEELLQIPGRFKPFECVGTKEEVEFALFLSIRKSEKLPLLLEKYQSYAKNRPELLTSWNSENFLPLEYQKLLKEKLNESW